MMFSLFTSLLCLVLRNPFFTLEPIIVLSVLQPTAIINIIYREPHRQLDPIDNVAVLQIIFSEYKAQIANMEIIIPRVECAACLLPTH